MKLEEWIVVMVPVSFILFLAVERIRPARKFPTVRGWHWIGMGFFIMSGVLNSLLPLLLPQAWLSEHRLFNLSALGLLPSVLIGHLAITFGTYLWHRACHQYAPLWRGFHQMHHAPRHLNVYAANVLHPADLAMYVVIPTFLALFVLGVDPLAAAILGNLGAFNAFFQHWNVRTPQWLGYLFQRPEAHCVHHQYGVHRDNYSDFPLWDMLFGTFRNPKEWEGATGFDEPADTRYGAMLAFVDVNAPIIGANRFGQARELASG
jgi:sterol desaturase/sphingolipid hydroxylase (fatty acid hydroxylase superfamily)